MRHLEDGRRAAETSQGVRAEVEVDVLRRDGRILPDRCVPRLLGQERLPAPAESLDACRGVTQRSQIVVALDGVVPDDARAAKMAADAHTKAVRVESGRLVLVLGNLGAAGG